MGISVPIREFAETMTSRMGSFDEKLGVNNYLTNTTLEEALTQLKTAVEKIEYILKDPQRKVVAKTYAVDAANSAMILWSKL
jgi:hypothetical protein